MREFRLSKNDKEHYTSFADLAKAFGCREPKKKRTNDENKLKADRERFLRTCPVCKSVLSYAGDNYVCCINPDCQGVKREFDNEDGTKRIEYFPVYRLLDSKGIEIGHNLFD